MRTIVAIFLIMSAGSAVANCESAAESYHRGLCFYDRGELDLAYEVLADVAEQESSEGIRAAYFMVRIQMKRGEWESASEQLIGLFGRSPAFYRLWNCDYLLGVCRRRAEGA